MLYTEWDKTEEISLYLEKYVDMIIHWFTTTSNIRFTTISFIMLV